MALAVSAGCARERPAIEAAAAPGPAPVWASCGDGATREGWDFARAPGGAQEVSADWLARNHCSVRVVDVREQDEVEGELGRVPGSQWVSLADVAIAAESWDRARPIVLVCRSGRRSARAAEQLESLGFRHVASLTGGMLDWAARGQRTQRGALSPSEVVAVPQARRAHAHTPDGGATSERSHEPAPDAGISLAESPVGPLREAELRARLSRPDAVRWTTAASVLSAGTESCIDGRSASHVLGAPGGDVGELVLALSVLERQSGRVVSDAGLDAMMGEYADSFGRLYLHTDEHTLAALLRSLRGDPRISAEHQPSTPEQALAFLRRPPAGLDEVALDHLTRPEHVGCGHLRALLERADAYQTRAPLVRAVLRAVLRLSWRRPEVLDLEVLSGEHHERAVLEVRVERAVHAHTRVPMVSPASAGAGVFVLHPQVEGFVRQESGDFLLEHAESLVGRAVDPRGYERAIASLGALQTRLTLARLAATLPAYEVLYRRDGTAVVQAQRPWGAR